MPRALWVSASLLLVAAVGSVFLWLNIAQISELVQKFVIQNQIVEVAQVTAPENATDTVAAAPVLIAESGQPVDAAGLPDKLSPAPETVSAPSVDEMPLTPNQITGDGALTRAGVINLTNRERQNYLGAGFLLTENSQLDLAAAAKVKDMFDGRYFDHLSPAGHGANYFVESAGYEFILIGENLALGDYAGDADLVRAWMDSPGHRKNILKSGFKEIGVAVGYGLFKGRKTWLAVQEFGTPKSVCPEIDSDLSAAIDAGKKILDQFSQQEDSLLAEINQEKAAAQTLQEGLNDLIAANSSAAVIKTKYAELNAAIAAVNKDVNAYNAAIGRMKESYDDYKSQITRYNQQVNAYNTCAAAIK